MISTSSSVTSAAAAAPALTYGWDASGQRVRKVLRSSDGSLTRTSHYLIDTAHAWPQVIARRSTDTNSAGQTLSRQITAWHWTTGATPTPTGDSLVRQLRIDGATGQSPGPAIQADLLPLAGHLGTSLGAVDAAGQVQEAVATDAFGQLRIPGSPANPGGFTSAPAGGWQQSHLFAGEYWDQDSQLLYLRARWYDPQIGRFISADPFEGRQRDPRSLNRYVYASSDPVHGTDPSGEMTLGDMGSAMSVMSTLAMNQLRAEAFNLVFSKLAPALIGSVPTSGPSMGGSPGGAAFATTLALMCRTTSKCLLKGVPLFSSGFDMPHHSIHIGLAIMHGGFTKSQGSNVQPFVLVRTPRNAVLRRNAKWPCKGVTGSGGMSCDEYPYATTLQGGELNWQADKVSLFPVPAWESNYQGGKLGAFYSPHGGDVGVAPSPKSLFLNVSIPAFPSFYINRAGRGSWR